MKSGHNFGDNLDLPKSLIVSRIPDDEVRAFKLRLETFGFLERKSQTGMVMARAKDCFDTEFYLGEIVVSESYVEYEGHLGYGMVLGSSNERAFILACYDIIEEKEMDSLKKLFQDWFRENEKYYVQYMEEQFKMFKATKVDFGLAIEG